MGVKGQALGQMDRLEKIYNLPGTGDCLNKIPAGVLDCLQRPDILRPQQGTHRQKPAAPMGRLQQIAEGDMAG